MSNLTERQKIEYLTDLIREKSRKVKELKLEIERVLEEKNRRPGIITSTLTEENRVKIEYSIDNPRMSSAVKQILSDFEKAKRINRREKP